MNEVVYYITYLHRCVPDYEACSLLNLVGILITSQVLLLVNAKCNGSRSGKVDILWGYSRKNFSHSSGARRRRHCSRHFHQQRIGFRLRLGCRGGDRRQDERQRRCRSDGHDDRRRGRGAVQWREDSMTPVATDAAANNQSTRTQPNNTTTNINRVFKVNNFMPSETLRPSPCHESLEQCLALLLVLV